MSNKVLPCSCGYAGALPITYNKLWYHAECPQCAAFVEAFTGDGLIALWNEKQLGIERQEVKTNEQ